MAYFQCNGTKACGSRCKATSQTGDVIVLPQLVPVPPGACCAVLGEAPEEDFMLRFEPCGGSPAALFALARECQTREYRVRGLVPSLVEPTLTRTPRNVQAASSAWKGLLTGLRSK